MRESDLHRACTRLLKERGWLYTKITSMGMYGGAGWPDLLCISPEGDVIFVELKLPGKSLSARQERMHNLLGEHWQEVHVIHTREEMREVLDGRQA